MKNYIKLLRVKHYIKNLLIFAPLFFSGALLGEIAIKVVYSFIPFCLSTSFVYIINDIKDVEKDKRHPTKCRRPIASGAVNINSAKIYSVIIMMLAAGFAVGAVILDLYPYTTIFLLAIYIILNILYSNGLKNVPVIDVLILAVGFVLRLYYGSCVTQVEISPWLYLTVVGGAFYLGMGKRRNEVRNQSDGNTRAVLRKYNYEFLDKNMYVCVAFTEVCYALWTIQSLNKHLIWTVPIIMVIFMKYSLNIESKDSEGDPINVLLEDKVMLGSVLLYGVIVFVSIYFV